MSPSSAPITHVNGTNGSANGHTNGHTTKRGGVAVYCGSSLGKHPAYQLAALSVGRAIAAAGRPLIYGGGNKGAMGTVSGASLLSGGKIIAVMPYAMVKKGGEGQKIATSTCNEEVQRALQVDRTHENIEHITVDSMHERKVIMAKRADGFIGLPGGYGTFEEVMEVTTWTQLGIHEKPTVLLNVLGFYTHMRQQLHVAVEAGFIGQPQLGLIRFVDCPEGEDETFDWGRAALKALDSWHKGDVVPLFDWTVRRSEVGETVGNDAMQST